MSWFFCMVEALKVVFVYISTKVELIEK